MCRGLYSEKVQQRFTGLSGLVASSYWFLAGQHLTELAALKEHRIVWNDLGSMAFTLIWGFQCVPTTCSGTLSCFMHINQRDVNVTPRQCLCWLTISMTPTTENISRQIVELMVWHSPGMPHWCLIPHQAYNVSGRRNPLLHLYFELYITCLQSQSINVCLLQHFRHIWT